MTDKTKKILGKICLVYAGIVLLGEVLITFIPSMAEMVKRSWEDHLVSLSTTIILGALGFHLFRGKTENNKIYRIVIVALILSPLANLYAASKAVPIETRIRSLPWVQTSLIVLSLIIVAVPYLFGERILKREESKPLRPQATPRQVLNIIGLGCAVMPSAIGCVLPFMGVRNNDMYYFVGLSYVAAAIWWGWWRYRYTTH